MDYGEWLKRNTNSIPDASEVVTKKNPPEQYKPRTNISIRKDFASLIVPYVTTQIAVRKWVTAFCANVMTYTSGTYSQMENELITYKLSDYLPNEYYEKWVELETCFPSIDMEERYLKFYESVIDYIREQE